MPDAIERRISEQKELKGDAIAQASLPIWEEAKMWAVQLKEAQKRAAEYVARTEAGGVMPTLVLQEELPVEASLEELVERLGEIDSVLEASELRALEASGELEDSERRAGVLTELTAQDRDELSEVVIPTNERNSFERARSENMRLRKALLEAQIESYQAEGAFLKQEQEQLPERIQFRREYNEELMMRKEALQSRIATIRNQEAKQTDLALQRSFEELSHIPQLAQVIAEIRQLNESRTGEDGVQAQIKSATEYEKQITRITQKIRSQKSNAREKIELLESVGLGIDTKTGILLREQRSGLPRTRLLQKQVRENVEVAVRSQVSLLDLQDELANHPPLGGEQVQMLMDRYEELERATVNELFEQREVFLKDLIAEHRMLNGILDRTNQKAQLTIDAIKQYTIYLDKRLLWSRSTHSLEFSEFSQEGVNLTALFGAEKLQRAFGGIRENWFSRFLPTLLLTTLFLFGVLRRRTLSRIEERASLKAVRRNCTSIRPTMETILSSVLIAFILPSLFFLGSLLIPEPLAYREGFWNAGVFLFVGNLICRFSRKDALFESHFKMSEGKVRRIREALGVFIPVLLPLVFVVGALCVSGGVGSSGRIFFMITMIVVMGLGYQLFHPRHSIVGIPDKVTLVSRLSYLLAMGLPFAFVVGAAMGFFSSVLILRSQVLATAGVLLAAFLVSRFLTRWILVSRRRLAIMQALKRREADLAQRAREESGDVKNDSDFASLEEVKAQAVDVVEVEEQTVQLVKVGVYFSVLFTIFSIWSSSLTALSILDQKPLWPNSRPVLSGEDSKVSAPVPLLPAVPGSDLGAIDEIGEELAPISELVSAPSNDFVSWQDLLLCLFVFLLTFVAARNIPGLLSLTVFSRLNLGPGGNFAFTTIVRYFIVLTGVVIGLNKIGITWDKVQWLAAAITLGVGFGLQEIFANFVAGLILLFERPLRLGDIVTVGNVSGRVTEIKIRATTIQQFNNRDLVVPNKDFITSQLTNWTLRDSVLRFELAVGIGYGSDTRKAEEILKTLVEKHDRILKDPAPSVIFKAFGTSTLDFLIRAHVGKVGDLEKTQHELHFLINDAFSEAGIEIAFPQQDIHLRSVPKGLSFTQD